MEPNMKISFLLSCTHGLVFGSAKVDRCHIKRVCTVYSRICINCRVLFFFNLKLVFTVIFS